MTTQSGTRLQKFLAEAGLASRRKAEAMIQSGRVRVNGLVVTELGTKVNPARDLVVVDGAPVERLSKRRYVLLYKPPGCVTTLSDPQGRPTARGYLQGVKERVFPVGRLDYDAEGALLFTDDGELANRLAHPSFGHKRVYLVKTKGDPDPKALHRLCEGVRLEDGPARALDAEVHEKAEKNTWIRIVVGEGRNHLVKRLCEAVGLPVLRLFRPEFGGITVERLRPGHWRDLTPDELEVVRAAGGMGGVTPVRMTVDPEELPKAGRRHGHGPPSQATMESSQPADRMREARRAEAQEPRRRSGRPGRPGRPGFSAKGRPDARGEGRREERGSDRRNPGAPAGRPAEGRRTAQPGRAGRAERTERSQRPGGPDQPQRKGRPGRTDPIDRPGSGRPPRGGPSRGRGPAR
jgi:23S rRNA pseudouridine2605 synthase